MKRQLPPVDEDVFAALQARAEPLVDDINSVLRRLLGLEQPPGPTHTPGRASNSSEQARRPRSKTPAQAKTKRATRGATLPDTEYELPVLQALTRIGGRAPAAEVIESVGQSLAPHLRDADLDQLASGEIRWRNRVQFARLRLVRSGDMANNSPRGTWEITSKGRSRISANDDHSSLQGSQGGHRPDASR